MKGADRVGGQLHGDKEYPFSGVTKSGRVWSRVPESDARNVCVWMCVCVSVPDHFLIVMRCHVQVINADMFSIT